MYWDLHRAINGVVYRTWFAIPLEEYIMYRVSRTLLSLLSLDTISVAA